MFCHLPSSLHDNDTECYDQLINFYKKVVLANHNYASIKGFFMLIRQHILNKPYRW